MTLAAFGLPFLALSSPDLWIPIQPFGVMVAIGMIIGGAVLRRYAARHGVGEDDVRSLMTWVIVSGFAGMHVFDVLLYQRAEIGRDPLLLLRFWDGISSWAGSSVARSDTRASCGGGG